MILIKFSKRKLFHSNTNVRVFSSTPSHESKHNTNSDGHHEESPSPLDTFIPHEDKIQRRFEKILRKEDNQHFTKSAYNVLGYL